MASWKDISTALATVRTAMQGEITGTEREELKVARAQLLGADANRKSNDPASAKDNYDKAMRTIQSIPD